MEETIVLDQEKKQVLWKVEAEQAQKNALSWKMLENNEIEGLLPFDYFYMDSQIHFRYPYQPLQRMEEYFQKKTGDYETLCFILEGIFLILERGREYLLDDTGYLLLPEWIFWNRYEKKLAVCYLPGREGNAEKDVTALVEYLLRRTEHSDKRAVTMIYGLYDRLACEGFIPENLLRYLHTTREAGGRAVEEPAESGAGERRRKTDGFSAEGSEREMVEAAPAEMEYVLEPLSYGASEKLHQALFGGRQTVFPLRSQEMTVGRKEDSDVYLPWDAVSRRHALLFQEEGGLYVMDTGSGNGTYLNGQKLSAYVKLPCGRADVLSFADISYRIAQREKDPGRPPETGGFNGKPPDSHDILF